MERRVVTAMGTGSWYRAKSDLVSGARPCGGRIDHVAPKIPALEQSGGMGSGGHARVNLGRDVVGVDARAGGADLRRLALRGEPLFTSWQVEHQDVHRRSCPGVHPWWRCTPPRCSGCHGREAWSASPPVPVPVFLTVSVQFPGGDDYRENNEQQYGQHGTGHYAASFVTWNHTPRLVVQRRPGGSLRAASLGSRRCVHGFSLGRHHRGGRRLALAGPHRRQSLGPSSGPASRKSLSGLDRLVHP